MRVCGGQIGEREVEQLEHYEERWNWLAPAPGAMVRSQPELSLRVMFEPMTAATGLVLMSMTHMSLVRAASGHHKDHVDVHGLCITGPSPHWMQRALESWSHLSSLANSRTGERRPCALPRQHSGTGPDSSAGV